MVEHRLILDPDIAMLLESDSADFFGEFVRWDDTEQRLSDSQLSP